MSEPVIPELDENGLFKMKIHPTPVFCCVRYQQISAMPHRRKYWVAMFLGLTLAPLLMAVFDFEHLDCGVIQDGKFRWFKATRRKAGA